MSLFLRYVITFDKQKRNLQFFYYVEYNVIKTEVGWIHQNAILAQFYCVKISGGQKRLICDFEYLGGYLN